MKTALIALLLTATPLTQAVEYNRVLNDKSIVTFAYKQMGVGMEGKFGKLGAHVAFDPSKPETARAQFDVYLNSINTGLSDADNELASKLWFNSKTYPLAQFVSSRVKSLGNNQYQAHGKLYIKGLASDMTIPFSIKSEANYAILEGSFPLKRLDFKIGEGSWSDVSMVANEVQVKFRVTLDASNK